MDNHATHRQSTELYRDAHANTRLRCALNQMSTTDSGTTRGGTPPEAAAEGIGPPSGQVARAEPEAAAWGEVAPAGAVTGAGVGGGGGRCWAMLAAGCKPATLG